MTPTFLLWGSLRVFKVRLVLSMPGARLRLAVAAARSHPRLRGVRGPAAQVGQLQGAPLELPLAPVVLAVQVAVARVQHDLAGATACADGLGRSWRCLLELP